MSSRSILITIGAVLLAFIAGFLVANGINRSQLDAIKTENEKLKAENSREASGELTLTADEIERALAEAANKPDNAGIQKRIGLSLYLYSTLKQDQALLGRSISILERAAELAADDLDVMTGLGNAYLDQGFYQKDNASFEKARRSYEKVLAKTPNNPPTLTNIGLTYSLQQPPDLPKAEEFLRRAVDGDPQQEKGLQFLVETLVRQNKRDEAAVYLEKLRTLNPNNEAIADLSAEISGVRPAPQQ